MSTEDGKRLVEPDPELNKLAHDVIGAAIAVHRALGPGFLEEVYRRALIFELRRRGFKVEPEKEFTIMYETIIAGAGRFDILVNDRLVLELKAVERFAPIHEAKVMHYLKAGHHKLGLLLNFHAKTMAEGIQRVVWSD